MLEAQPDLPPGAQVKWLTPVEWETGEPPLVMLMGGCAALSLIVPCLLAVIFGPLRGAWSKTLQAGGKRGKSRRVALVVAHPDDEAMFFWPTLRELSDAGIPLSVLCLSTGNADGLGETRTVEMQKSCGRLGVSGSGLKILDVDGLQDGFHEWSEELVAKHVQDFLKEQAVEIVLTFDDYGVSGHPNHRSTSRGVRRAHAEALRTLDDTAAANGHGVKSFDLYMLESVGFLRKYIGPLCLLLPNSRLESSSCLDVTACLRALYVHWTQLVWYRVLFTVFSHYAYLNIFVHVQLGDADANSKGGSDGDPAVTTASQVEATKADDSQLRHRRLKPS